MTESTTENTAEERRLAITVAGLYLGNLLLLPGLLFLVMLIHGWRHRNAQSELFKAHFKVALTLSLIAGACLLIAPIILYFAGNPAIWMTTIVVWVTLHGGLVMVGIYTLSRAMSGMPPYPERGKRNTQ